jgi:hypothetical protein
VFFYCKASILARQNAGLDHIILPRLQQLSNARDVIFVICSSVDADTAGLFAVLVSVLWSNRNNMVWNETSEPGRMLGFKARHVWDDWHSVQRIQHGTTSSDQQQHIIIRWEKPLSGWYKCNVDAAFHKEINKTSTGWILRDHFGRFIAAETTWIDGSCSIVEGESIALLEALKVMEQRGYSHVFESDSKSVVDAIHHFQGGNSEFSLLVSNINNFLACN